MNARIPVSFEAEYRGAQPAGEFNDEETGATVGYTAGLRFEVDLPDGDVATVTVRQGKLDQVADFDSAALVKGERVEIVGSVSLGNRSNPGGFLQMHSVRQLAAV